MQAFLTPTWLLIAALFSYLAYNHWRISQTPLRPFQFRREAEAAREVTEGERKARELIRDFNNYLEAINQKNLGRNRRAVLGYFLAAFVALASLFLSVP